jgi:hypothetical protein
MSVPMQAGDVLPRPRIPTVVGMLNIIFASCLLLVSLTLGAYNATMPLTMRAMTQILKKAEADAEAKRQVDLKALEVAEKKAATEEEKRAIEKQRKALSASRKFELPIGMDFEKMGLKGRRFAVFAWVDVATAVLLDIVLIVSGIGLLRRQMWGLRLGLAALAAKLVRLVLLYGYVAVAIIPPIAQGSGRVAFEAMAQQLKATGQPMPPGVDALLLTRVYSITYTVMAVAMILFGSIYPAIALWFLSRPGARSACEERTRYDLEPVGTRVVGTLNIVFASALILFGLCMGAYITALPFLGRTLGQIQKQQEAKAAAQQEAARKSVEEALAKAATEEEKKDLEAQREVLESRPKLQNVQMAQMDFSMMGLNDPKLRAYYWIELASGLFLNVCMIVAGIGLLRRKRWGITLGIGTALAKIVRLVAVYSYFALALSASVAQQTAQGVGRMIAQQQVVMGAPEPPTIDAAPLVQAYRPMYEMIPAAMIVLGSIYPAIALYVLVQARAARSKKGTPDILLHEMP